VYLNVRSWTVANDNQMPTGNQVKNIGLIARKGGSKSGLLFELQMQLLTRNYCQKSKLNYSSSVSMSAFVESLKTTINLSNCFLATLQFYHGNQEA